MILRRRHKILIGTGGSLMIVFMVVTGILIFTLFTRQELNYYSLNDDLQELRTDTQTKLNELTINLIQTKETLEESQEELTFLKASAGDDFSGIVEDAIKSVVTIRTDISQGTGFIINQQGYIVTNAHILVGGREVNAITSEQENIKAEFIGYDGEFDIALLKIQGNYEEIKIADSNNIQIGEKVIAIGNPLGLQFSVSEGIVSAVQREGPGELEAYIQTDAALNPGNSGGPLINKKGKVIGINNFKIGGGESLGFALESNHIKNTVNEISQEALQKDLL